MSRKSVIEREKKRRILVKKFEKKRSQIKKELLITDDFQLKLDLQEKLQKLPRNSSQIRLRNRCWKTGRGRGVYKDFGLCRHILREMANDGYLPGLIKSSW